MKASTKVLAGFLFAMGASAAYKLSKSEQDQENLKAKLNDVQSQLADMVDKASTAVQPYIEQAKASYVSSKEALSDSVVPSEDDNQEDIELEETDLDLNK
ncbi:hypothetical protein [Fructobacillus parabroussonetiae]|uniref:YtxH domain-containing protein n=1 Tax=Fructobacillus parabroussonetiae TaxID=2713174 RepID=A0ABS5QXG9_9LACO|nr:hypothetical protein [Fructobacillus parabroussonetiae]MBS9337811.1 hypothetical protein [Fructobacillus parabroussonetiae]MCK8617660.1 hypothetical protein [Fructobacillus parabroussonetiae]